MIPGPILHAKRDVFCLLFFGVQGLEMSGPVCGHLADFPGKRVAREHETEAVLIGITPQQANMTRNMCREVGGVSVLHGLCLQSYGYQVDVVVVGR